jgi:Tol biopolymer transport system component
VLLVEGFMATQKIINRRTRTFLIGGILFWLLGVLATPGAPAASSQSPRAYLPFVRTYQPQLLFTGYETIDNTEIYSVNADGSQVTNLTKHPAIDYQLASSPDGSKIAFIRVGANTDDIFTMNADGSDQQNVTHGSCSCSTIVEPLWSPDGKKIALFQDPNEGIYVMNADGSSITIITGNQLRFYQHLKTWSPDSSKLAFDARSVKIADLTHTDIYVGNADGSGYIQLTKNQGRNSAPQWSPDGSRIMFESDRDGNSDIFVMNTDGSNQINLTHAPDFEFTPIWSPDGRAIVFSLFNVTADNSDIYTMNADGSNRRQLTNTSEGEGDPLWSPDGKYIAFYRGGNLYAMNADGSNAHLVTDQVDTNYRFAWKP